MASGIWGPSAWARVRSLAFGLILSLSALPMASAVASAPKSQSYSPTGKWLVAFDDDMCTASRPFAEGSDQMTLVFRPFPTQQAMEVVIIEPGSGSESARRGSGRITLDPGGVGADVSYESFGLSQRQRITHINANRSLLTDLANASTLTIAIDRTVRTIPLTSTKPLMATLHRCEVELLTGWGVDPKLFFDTDPPVPVQGNPAQWFGPSVYPSEAVREHQQGRVIALLAIDTTGRVTNCRIVTSSKSRSLDAATCANANRIRYAPSHSASGQPIASWSILPVVWRLP